MLKAIFLGACFDRTSMELRAMIAYGMDDRHGKYFTILPLVTAIPIQPVQLH